MKCGRSMELCGGRPTWRTIEGESNSGRGEAVARCGCSIPVLSFRQVACFGAAALRQRVLHGGGLLGVVVPASLSLFRRWTPLLVRRLQMCGLWVDAAVGSVFIVIVMCNGLAVLISQSNWPVSGNSR
jgi:hypothetical protein